MQTGTTVVGKSHCWDMGGQSTGGHEQVYGVLANLSGLDPKKEYNDDFFLKNNPAFLNKNIY